MRGYQAFCRRIAGILRARNLEQSKRSLCGTDFFLEFYAFPVFAFSCLVQLVDVCILSSAVEMHGRGSRKKIAKKLPVILHRQSPRLAASLFLLFRGRFGIGSPARVLTRERSDSSRAEGLCRLLVRPSLDRKGRRQLLDRTGVGSRGG
jgi:hypothetical protein